MRVYETFAKSRWPVNRRHRKAEYRLLEMPIRCWHKSDNTRSTYYYHEHSMRLERYNLNLALTHRGFYKEI
jgi:hypothetical protein